MPTPWGAVKPIPSTWREVLGAGYGGRGGEDERRQTSSGAPGRPAIQKCESHLRLCSGSLRRAMGAGRPESEAT